MGFEIKLSTITTVTPPLRQGDCLKRDEFERRYEAMPNVKKAELIEGVVYMPPPVSNESTSVGCGRMMA
ncbi:MAG: hypothetical protein HYV60_11530 [Planctomycetia bacterium]|nr:hypothetical protein [Planctomycetia bacterium]